MPYGKSPKKNKAFKMKAKNYNNSPMMKNFPDLTGDGKVTQADILKGRGVELKKEAPMKMMTSDNMLDGRSRSAAFQKKDGKKKAESVENKKKIKKYSKQKVTTAMQTPASKMTKEQRDIRRFLAKK